MRNYLAILLFVFFPLTAMAAPVSWDFNIGTSILQPLQSAWTALIKGDHFQATSTTASSTLPKLESTVSNALSVCINGDCKAAWPTSSVATSTNEIAGYLPYWTSTSGTPALLGKVATTSVTCSGSISCTSFTVIGSSPITISASSGSAFPFTPQADGNATSTELIFKSGYLSTASSTQNGNLFLSQLGTAAGTFLAVDATGKIIATTTLSISNTTGYKDPVNYATTAALPANTYLAGVLTEVGTGALSVDSASPVIGNRILVKNEVTQTNNGVYDVTATGSGIAAYVLTRSFDYNTSSKLYPGVANYVISGTTNGDTSWALTTAAPITLDSSNLTYAESANGNIQIPVTVAQGGTGVQTFTASQLLYGNGTSALSSAATTTEACSTGIACTTHVVLGTGGTITLATMNAGVLGSLLSGVAPTSQATSTLFGGTATFGVGKVGIASTTPAFTLSVNNSGSDFYVTSTGKTVNRDPSTGYPGVNSPLHRLTLSTATTTAWYATTTGAYIPYVVAPFAGTIQNAQCSTATSTQGFLGIDTYIGSTHLAYFVASSTVGTITFSSNNTFTAGQLINMSVGTTTNSQSSSASCTYGITETP